MGGVGGHFNASEEFTGSRVLGLSGGRRLPGGLRGSCRGLPLVGRAHARKKPGGDRLRALACTDPTGRAANGRGSRSLRAGVAARLETVHHRSGSGTGVQRGGPLRSARAHRIATPDDDRRHARARRIAATDDDRRHEAGGGAHRDRPRRSAVAGRIEAPDDDHRHETSAGVDGDRALGVAVAGRIRTTDSRHNRGGGIHGPHPCGGEENPHQAQDRSPRAALARGLEPDELLCLGFR
jgi:hypothetical protein